jgi:4-hydroxybenzoate polyprenyltransferase
MNDENNNSPPPQWPPEEPAPTPLPSSKGSLAFGILLAWAIVLGGIVVSFVSKESFINPFNITALPVAIVIAIILIVKGKSRTGIGIFLGLASMAAVVLLLVAACFGLVSFSR